MPRSRLSLFPGVFLRGMLMGAADIVPGVSGGTVAFITGIYQRLLDAITACDLEMLGALLRGEWRGAWLRVDGLFLLALFSGIALSVVTLSGLITHWLATQPLLIWSFFFGLIVASAILLLRQIESWSWIAVVGLFLGAAIAVAMGLAPAMSLAASPGNFFFAGFLAICAMILPGISGSFILVLLGMYPTVLAAVRNFDLEALALLTAGALCGLLLFARFLRVLLERFHSRTMATLTGFLLGSLPVVWPWKLSIHMGQPAQPVLPSVYAESLGHSQWATCLLLMALGIGAVWLLEYRWGGLER